MRNQVNPESLVNLSLLESIRQTKPTSFYLDHFVLLMLSLLPKNKNKIQTVDIQQLFLEKLSIKIPLASVNKISQRAVKNGYFRIVHYQENNKIYEMAHEKIRKNTLKFDKLRDEITESQKVFFLEFQKFIRNKYQTNMELPECQKIFNKHFIKHYINIENINTLDEFKSCKIDNENYVVNSFIFSLYKNQNYHLLKCLELIIRGTWCSNYLFMWKNDSHKNTLKGITVFLDTPIIISLLGFHGHLSEKIIKELIILLKELKVNICVFSHNIEETQSILKSWAYNIAHNKLKNMRLEVVKEIRSKSYDYQRLHSLAINLKGFLSSLKINEKFDPDIPRKYRVDEMKLEQSISHPKSYYTGQKVLIDIKSAIFIFSLRKGSVTLNITDKPYIFVSSTYHVVNSINNFFKEEYPNSANKNVPLIVMQNWITNLCWISSSKKTSFPKDFLIANSYASLNADSKFWEIVKEKLKTLEQQDKITEEGINAIRYEEDFKYCVEEHFVLKNNITEKDIHHLIQKSEREKYKKYEKEIEILKREQIRFQDNKKNISNKLGALSIFIVGVVLLSLIFYYYGFSIGTVFSLLSFCGITFSYKKTRDFLSKKINKYFF